MRRGEGRRKTGRGKTREKARKKEYSNQIQGQNDARKYYNEKMREK